MRRISIIIIAALITAAAHAESRYVAFEVSNGTNATTTVTQTQRFSGVIDEVYIQAPTAGQTAAVHVAVSPNVGTGLAGYLLASNATFSAALRTRPRYLGTTAAGVDLSSLAIYERIVAAGDPIVFSVTQATSATGQTYKAWVKVTQ